MFDNQKRLIARAAFSGLFLSLLLLKSYNSNIETVLAPGECLKDLTFEVTAQLNRHFAQNLDHQHFYLAFAGLTMDICAISAIFQWLLKTNTIRVFYAMIVFYIVRAIVQNNLVTLGKPEGYLWDDPHFPSLIISYFPSNDFYYSGHIGSTTIYLSEFIVMNNRILLLIGIFTFINNWLMLTIMQGHFFIDLITGFCVGRTIFVLGEKISYYFDVKPMGLPRHKRESFYYKPCAVCGWNNEPADLLVYPTELNY